MGNGSELTLWLRARTQFFSTLFSLLGNVQQYANGSQREK